MVTKRIDSLLPNGIPRYIRCYDQPECGERYTVVFTGRYRKHPYDEFIYLGMNSQPFHGIGQHGHSNRPIDESGYSQIGKPIAFAELPEDCQKATLQTYREIWKLQQTTKGKHNETYRHQNESRYIEQ